MIHLVDVWRKQFIVSRARWKPYFYEFKLLAGRTNLWHITILKPISGRFSHPWSHQPPGRNIQMIKYCMKGIKNIQNIFYRVVSHFQDKVGRRDVLSGEYMVPMSAHPKPDHPIFHQAHRPACGLGTIPTSRQPSIQIRQWFLGKPTNVVDTFTINCRQVNGDNNAWRQFGRQN